MSIPSSGQNLNMLRRRRDFLAGRIRSNNEDLSYDKSEHTALSWAIQFIEERYQPGSRFPVPCQGWRERPGQTVKDRQSANRRNDAR